MVIKRSGAIISVLLIFILSIFVPNYVYSQPNWEFSSRFELLPPSQSFREFLNTNGNLEEANLGYIPSLHDFSYLKGFKPKAAEINSYPSSFDLRTQGKLSPVKNQGPYGTCWAFSTYGSLESSLLPGESWDFSEDNMVNLHGFDLGYNAGGNYDMATAYLVRWSGPVNESDDPYSDHWSPQGLPSQKHVQEVLYLPPRSGPGDNDTIKWALMNYGGVGTSIYWDDSYYNSTYKSYYYSGTATVNHAVVIVGWDDNYDKARFSGASGTPPGNGAFIVRNSWGSSWGEGGYFYVSYYDSRIGSDNAVFNNAEPVTNYGKIYQYDTLGWTTSGSFGSQTGWFAAVFQTTSTETISAVGFYSSALNSSYEVYAQPSYTGSNLKGSLVASGTLSLPGFHTVSFAPQPIPPGYFSVAVKLTTPGFYSPIPVEYPISGYSSTATALPGQTFVSSDGSSWQDLNSIWPNSSVCLKAYAQVSSQPSPSLSFTPSSFTFTATQGGSNPPSQTLEVWNSGGGSMSWTVSKDALWLTLSPTSGNSSGEHDQVTVSVYISGLASGTYSTTITLSGEGASNSPQYLPVTLQVNPPKVLNSLSINPSSWTFTSSTPKQFQATAYFSDGSFEDVTSSSSWSSDNPSVASVNSSGLVTPIFNGSTYIHASYTYNGVTKTAQSSITVDFPHIVSITSGPSASPSTIPSGGSTNLSVSASDSLGHTPNYSWSVVSSSIGSGSFSNPNIQNPTWTAPQNLTGVNQTVTLKVRASCSLDSTKYAEGTVNVTVLPLPSLTVTSPNGGESWTIGSTKNITWTSTGLTGDVKIELNRSYPTGSWEVLFASTPNDGNESWQVSGPSSSSCRLRITSLSNPSVSDISDNNLSILSPPSLSFTPSSFTFTATQGGVNPPPQTLEVWNSGGGTLNWAASKNSSWLSLSPTSGNSSGE
ncbi:MAG: lectin like domain-containing protein, partial [bacterium]